MGVSIVRILEKIDLVITAAHWISVLFFAYRLHISPVTASTKCLYWELEMLQHQGVDMWVSKVEETGNTVEVKMSLECERLFHQCVAWWDQRSTETIFETLLSLQIQFGVWALSIHCKRSKHRTMITKLRASSHTLEIEYHSTLERATNLILLKRGTLCHDMLINVNEWSQLIANVRCIFPILIC